MTEDFFHSDQVRESLEDIQTTYTELLKMSAGFAQYDIKKRVEHIDKTLDLIAKQKVFYARLALASHEEGADEAIDFIKDRVDTMSMKTTGGMDLMSVLQVMEDKLLGWKKELKNAES
ncbi:hypothetical protein PTIM40_4 [Cyanophage P-TIM40]|uniref:DUF1825 domain-containing protein n=1 Tax=Cyanophage P-TIM40 TaxID=1589733 RepID=A0A0C5AAP7_9CAUD|nr:DUF1825 family protein [Cyanophage P-TIM40]AJK27431.1 hypothetical protein PTIM40_4 [Cyanophage P-TIM40]